LLINERRYDVIHDGVRFRPHLIVVGILNRVRYEDTLHIRKAKGCGLRFSRYDKLA
jgi:hypothetical protein